MADDARYRTKLWLDANLEDANLTKDNGTTEATFTVCYSDPPYPLLWLFSGLHFAIDLVYAVGVPESEALPVGVGYVESVPVTIWCVDKIGITGTKLRWTAEDELRRVAETFPHGSLRTLTRMSDNEQYVGSTTLYSVTYVLKYKRYAT